MKITVKEEYIANGSYECMIVTATTELGVVVLSRNEDDDRDRDLKKEHTITVTDFESFEAFKKQRYDNWDEIFEIMDDDTWIAFRDAKAADLEAAKEAGDTENHYCEVDGKFYDFVRGRWKVATEFWR